MLLVLDNTFVCKYGQLSWFLFFLIHDFVSILYERGLSECSSGAFDRVANTFTELASHEKALDDLIDFLRKDQVGYYLVCVF